MANKKISQLTAVTTLSNNDVFPVVQGTTTYKAKISDIKSYLPTASSLLTGLLSNTDWVTFNNKQNALTLGNLTESTSSVLTITGGTGAIIGSGLTIQVKQASGSQSGFLSSTDWTTFNSKMSSLTLTTTGTSGAATLVGSTLNIPQYLGSAITSLGGQTGATQTFSTDNTGTDFTISSVSNNHKFSIPNASGSARGLLTSTDFSTFSNKEDAVTWGSLTETTSSILTITGGSSAVRGNVTVAVKQVTGLQDGYLGKGDYSTFLAKQDAITLTTTGSSGAATFINNVLNIPQYASGITSLNALTAGTQTFATGTSGSDFNISSSTSTHTFNIPDAGASARGMVTTGTQTLAGAKTFSSAPTFSTMTAGSVLFAGTSGLLSQDNSNLFWDNTNKRLGIGTSTPLYRLEVKGSITASSALAQLVNFEPTLTASANNDFLVATNINATFSLGAFTGTSSYLQRWQTAGFTRSFIRNTGLQQWNFNSGTVEAGRIEYGTPGGNTGMAIFDYDTATSTYINRYNFANEGTYFYQGFHSINTLGGMALFNTSHNLVLGYTGTPIDAGYKLDVNGTARIQDNLTISDAKNIIFGTSTGNKIGTATSQKIGFWNATPIVQPTTAVASATVTSPGGGNTIKTDDTFDGYTLQQVVKALRNTGILA